MNDTNQTEDADITIPFNPLIKKRIQHDLSLLAFNNYLTLLGLTYETYTESLKNMSNEELVEFQNGYESFYEKNKESLLREILEELKVQDSK